MHTVVDFVLAKMANEERHRGESAVPVALH
jgi:hypothetical protein